MIQLLRKTSLFANLTPTQLDLIAQRCVKRVVKAHTVLFQEKDAGSEFYIIISGAVKIYTSRDGEDKVLSIITQGDSFGELALLDGKPRSASAATLEDSVLFVLDKPNFLDVLQEHFDITIAILQELSQRLRDTNQHIHDLTFLDSRTRVLKHLIQMANKHGQRNGSRISMKVMLNLEELSRMAGVEKESLSDVITELQSKSILLIEDEGFSLDLSKLRS